MIKHETQKFSNIDVKNVNKKKSIFLFFFSGKEMNTNLLLEIVFAKNVFRGINNMQKHVFSG